MSNFRREAAPTTARETLRLLEDVGYVLPDHAAAALARLDRVEGMRPQPVTAEDVRRAFAADDADPAALAHLAALAAGSHVLTGAHANAVLDAAVALDQELRALTAEVIEHLRPTAEDACDALTWFAQNGSPDPGALLRAGKSKDAKRAADATYAHADLLRLHKVRAAVTPRGFKWDGLTFRSRRVFRPYSAATLADTVASILDDAELWWPTWPQALDAAESRDTSRQAADDEEHAAVSRAKQSAL